MARRKLSKGEVTGMLEFGVKQIEIAGILKVVSFYFSPRRGRPTTANEDICD